MVSPVEFGKFSDLFFKTILSDIYIKVTEEGRFPSLAVSLDPLEE